MKTLFAACTFIIISFFILASCGSSQKNSELGPPGHPPTIGNPGASPEPPGSRCATASCDSSSSDASALPKLAPGALKTSKDAPLVPDPGK